MRINTIKFTVIMSLIALIAYLGYGLIYATIDEPTRNTIKAVIIALCPILGIAITNLFRKPGS